MNLEEFRKALSSDATEDNIRLKKQLENTKVIYQENLSKFQDENDSLKKSCRVLCKRCFALTGGTICLFCGIDYPCPYMPSFEEKMAAAHKLRKITKEIVP